MLKRLLHMTHVFQLSRLFHKHWRTIPVVATGVVCVNAYKRRAALTAQDADVAPTAVGVTYLRFTQNEKTDTCALYAHHRHICAWQKTPHYSQLIVLSTPNP